MAFFPEDCTGELVQFDFGRLSRSIQIESTTFELDRFVKDVHHEYPRPYLVATMDAAGAAPPAARLPAGVPLEFPKSA